MVSRFNQYGPLPIRVALGIVYFVHGIGKLAGVGLPDAAIGIAGTTGFLASLGFPMPGVFAWILAIVETFGGLAILFGILTRYVSVLIAIDAFLATVLVNFQVGFIMLTTEGGWEFTFVLLLAAISLVLSGAGALSVERLVRGEEWVPRRLQSVS